MPGIFYASIPDHRERACKANLAIILPGSGNGLARALKVPQELIANDKFSLTFAFLKE